MTYDIKRFLALFMSHIWMTYRDPVYDTHTETSLYRDPVYDTHRPLTDDLRHPHDTQRPIHPILACHIDDTQRY